MSFIIRKAELRDASTAAEIVCTSWKAAYRDIITPDSMAAHTDLEKRTELFRNIVSAGQQGFYIILDNDKSCGFCTFDKTEDEDLSGMCEIIAFYFLPQYWGKGCAQKFMTFLMKEIKMLGYKKVSLWTLEENARARHFYEKYGFSFDGVKKESGLGENKSVVRYALSLI